MIVHRSIYSSTTIVRPRICRMFIMYVLNSSCLQPQKICLFWLQSPVDFRANTRRASASLRSSMRFIWASIFGRIERKIRKHLPRSAHPCDLIWLQTPVKFRPKIREVLARYAWICDLFWLQSPATFIVKYNSNNRTAVILARPVDWASPKSCTYIYYILYYSIYYIIL